MMSLKSLLSVPAVYEALQQVMGSSKGRPVFAREYVKARRGDRVLDIGCGPGSLRDFLPDVDYLGFDANPAYIQYAEQRYAGRGRFRCQIVTADAIKDEPPFDIVIGSAILHHLSDDDAVALFTLAKSVLNENGRLVTLDPCYIENQSPIARFLISRDRGDYVRDAERYEQLAKSVFPRVISDIRHDLSSFPYTHVILQCSA